MRYKKTAAAGVLVLLAGGLGLWGWMQHNQPSDETEQLGTLPDDIEQEPKDEEPEQKEPPQAPEPEKKEEPTDAGKQGDARYLDQSTQVWFRKVYLPSLGIKMYIPDTWTADTSNPEMIYFTCKDDPLYQTTRFFIGFHTLPSRNPEKLPENSREFLRQHLYYQSASGEKMSAQGAYTAGAGQVVLRNHGSTDLIWYNTRDMDAYQEYDEIPADGGEGWKQDGPFVCTLESGNGRFTAPSGHAMEASYLLQHRMMNGYGVVAGLITPDSDYGAAQNVVSRIIGSVAELSEKEKLAVRLNLSKECTGGGLSFKLPETFSGGSGRYKDQVLGSPTYDMGVLVIELRDTDKDGFDPQKDANFRNQIALFMDTKDAIRQTVKAHPEYVSVVTGTSRTGAPAGVRRLESRISFYDSAFPLLDARCGRISPFYAEMGVYTKDGKTYALIVTSGTAGKGTAKKLLSEILNKGF